MSELKTYIAIARGYVDEHIVEEGEVFSTSAKKGSWMELVEEEKPRRGRPPVEAASDE